MDSGEGRDRGVGLTLVVLLILQYWRQILLVIGLVVMIDWVKSAIGS